MTFVTTRDSSVCVWASKQGTDEQLHAGLNAVIAKNVKSLMILACSNNSYSTAVLTHLLTSCPVPICGGTFPSVFYADTVLDEGFIVVGFPFLISVSCYRNLSTTRIDILHPDILDGGEIEPDHDLVVIIDAMSATTEIFINTLYETIGGGINVIGGGAGNVDFIQKNCIFCRAGLLEDSALIIRIPVPVSSAVEHGWQILNGPYLITESSGTSIKTINYFPAFLMYKEIIEKITSYRFHDDNFFSISKKFPLGILGINGDILVRDPIQMLDDELICVGSVPVNSMIYILQGQENNLISAAEMVSKKANFSSGLQQDSKLNFNIAFDCVSRVLYLGESFSEELIAIQRGAGKNKVIVGALSIGEIGNTAQGTIALLNKSIIIGSI